MLMYRTSVSEVDCISRRTRVFMSITVVDTLAWNVSRSAAGGFTVMKHTDSFGPHGPTQRDAPSHSLYPSDISIESCDLFGTEARHPALTRAGIWLVAFSSVGRDGAGAKLECLLRSWSVVLQRMRSTSPLSASRTAKGDRNTSAPFPSYIISSSF